jgi:hypothetical protein
MSTDWNEVLPQTNNPEIQEPQQLCALELAQRHPEANRTKKNRIQTKLSNDDVSGNLPKFDFTDSTCGQRDVLVSITEAINALSREEFARLPAGTFRDMSSEDFAALSTTSITRLGDEHWSQLHPAHMQALTRDQIRSIYPWSIKTIPVVHLTETQLTHLTEDQRNALSSAQLDQIGRDRLRHLFGNLPPAAHIVTRLAPEDIRLLPDSTIARIFPPESLPHLLPGQFSALTQRQLRALLCQPKRPDSPLQERINTLTASQIHAILMRYQRGKAEDRLHRALSERSREIDTFDY